MSLGLLKASIIAPASVFAAIHIPFDPMLVPPAATACQLWAAVPGTQVAVLNPAVGTIHLMSLTSVLPPLSSSGPNFSIVLVDSSGIFFEKVSEFLKANSFSAGVYV